MIDLILSLLGTSVIKWRTQKPLILLECAVSEYFSLTTIALLLFFIISKSMM
jgi:hypothetical protein